MAISSKDCSLLFFSKKLGVSFERTITLGRLKLYAQAHDVANNQIKYGIGSSTLFEASEYAEALFELLGATKTDSLDYSDYEHATCIHDMNLPIPESLKNKFTAVVDGGTLEHIFNFPVAIKNCMNMLEVGGHFIGISPANNQLGHGFYQFSPELFYRIFSLENGFVVKKMLITPTETGAWYEVADPAAVKSRVMLTNHLPLSVTVIAQKVKEVEIFRVSPLQSDYQAVWNISESLKNDVPPDNESKIKFLYRKFVPKPLKRLTRFFYDLLFLRSAHSDELGTYNSDHFKRIDL